MHFEALGQNSHYTKDNYILVHLRRRVSLGRIRARLAHAARRCGTAKPIWRRGALALARGPAVRVPTRVSGRVPGGVPGLVARANRLGAARARTIGFAGGVQRRAARARRAAAVRAPAVLALALALPLALPAAARQGLHTQWAGVAKQVIGGAQQPLSGKSDPVEMQRTSSQLLPPSQALAAICRCNCTQARASS